MTDKITRKSVLRELPVELADQELLEVARDKARREAALEELQASFTDVKRDWNARIEADEKVIAQLGAIVRTGQRRQPVDCFERYQTEGEHKGKVEVVRKDTDEVVERRVADLLEARNALPPEEGDVAAQAARMQRAAGVEENDEGDVVPPDEAAPKKRGRGGKRS